MKLSTMPSSSILPTSLRKPLSKILFWVRRYKAQQKFMMQAIKSNKIACSVAYNKFGAYCVPNSAANRPASLKVLQGQVYEPETIDFICKSQSVNQEPLNPVWPVIKTFFPFQKLVFGLGISEKFIFLPTFPWRIWFLPQSL